MESDKNNKSGHNRQGVNRREFIRLGLVAAASCMVPFQSLASTNNSLHTEKTLNLYNLHTKENLRVTYFKDGEYIAKALAELNHIFRDHYNGSVRPINTTLLNLLFDIQEKLHSTSPFNIISGYRSAKTNYRLRRNNKGVAKNSLHMYGKAVDIRLPGCKLKTLRRAAYELKAGGVGYYAKNNFVHLDVGQVRYWYK